MFTCISASFSSFAYSDICIEQNQSCLTQPAILSICSASYSNRLAGKVFPTKRHFVAFCVENLRYEILRYSSWKGWRKWREHLCRYFKTMYTHTRLWTIRIVLKQDGLKMRQMCILVVGTAQKIPIFSDIFCPRYKQLLFFPNTPMTLVLNEENRIAPFLNRKWSKMLHYLI